MKLTLGTRGGRLTSRIAACENLEPPVPVGDEDDPALDVASESAAERWDRLIAELEEDGALEPDPKELISPSYVRFHPNPEPAEPRLIEQAFGVMGRMVEALANRPSPPPPPAPVVHVHNHDPDLSVNVHPAAGPNVNVTLPEQEPPRVDVHNHLPGQEPPRVEVTVEAAEVPDVHVDVAAPDVRVEPQIQVQVEPQAAPRPSSVRLEVDDDGTRRFVVEDEEEEE